MTNEGISILVSLVNVSLEFNKVGERAASLLESL
jgi:hypothetical protein